MSMSSDDYPYDTSECCSSSGPSNSASLTKIMEQKLYAKRSSRVKSEHQLRFSSDFHLGDSILGQVRYLISSCPNVEAFNSFIRTFKLFDEDGLSDICEELRISLRLADSIRV